MESWGPPIPRGSRNSASRLTGSGKLNNVKEAPGVYRRPSDAATSWPWSGVDDVSRTAWAQWCSEPTDFGGLRVHLFGSGGVLVKTATGSRLGYLYLAKRGLQLEDERARPEALMALEAAGLGDELCQLGDDLQDLVPFADARLSYSGGKAQFCGVLPGNGAKVTLGTIEAPGGQLTVPSWTPVEAVHNLVARHGLSFSCIVLREEVAPRSAVVTKSRQPKVGVERKPHANLLAIVPRQHLQHLLTNWKVVPQVAWLADPELFQWTSEKRAAIAELVAGQSTFISLAETASGRLAMREARNLSSLHGPLLAAALLVEQEPDATSSMFRNSRFVKLGKDVIQIAGSGNRYAGHIAQAMAVSIGLDRLVLSKRSAGAVLFAVAALFAPALPTVDRPKRPSCRICGARASPAQMSLGSLLFTRDPRYCAACATKARLGGVPDLGMFGAWEESVVWALRELVEEFGGPPSRGQLSEPLRGLEPAARDRAIALRMLLPYRPSDVARVEAMGVADRKVYSWSEWLARAGLLETGVRRSRGWVSTAQDGHLCSSLLELHVDDFMHRHGIIHEKEPAWPAHAHLNMTGLRADWLLEDGTMVEAFGMKTSPEYADKIKRKRKRALAEELGLRLIEVDETDLPHLREIFTHYLARSSG